MADDIYIIEDLARMGPTIVITDDGSGIDELRFETTFPQVASITLSWSWGSSPQAAGTYFPEPPPSGAGGRLIVHGQIENARGSNGRDDIIGNPLANVLYGDAARVGAGGSDTLSAADGDDSVYGGVGDDLIGGDAGRDLLFGDDGADNINGGGDRDTIQGGAGADTLSGGSDVGDTVSYSESAGGVTVELETGSITQGRRGDAQGDRLHGFTDIVGSSFADVLTDLVDGMVGANLNGNLFLAGDGNDRLLLGGGDDEGRGGKGADRLTGGQGADLLAGGQGADRFIYLSVGDSTVAVSDRIADLAERDRIDLSAIDADLGAAGDQGFRIVRRLTGDAGQMTVKFREADGHTEVLGDVDGDGAADLRILLTGDHADFGGFVL